VVGIQGEEVIMNNAEYELINLQIKRLVLLQMIVYIIKLGKQPCSGSTRGRNVSSKLTNDASVA
jgi:hypothetical protein